MRASNLPLLPGAARWALMALLAGGCDEADRESGAVEGADCDPEDPRIGPYVQELCANGIDDDCDGLVDGDDPDAEGRFEAFEDADGDGYAGTSLGYTCDAAVFTESTDCDDASPAISPAAEEICGDGLDNNCDRASRECPGIGLDEAYDSADTLYLALAPHRLESAAGAPGACGDLDGDGAIDVVTVLEVLDPGREYYYGESKGPWITIAVFDGDLRGSVTAAEAWARPVDQRAGEGWTIPDLQCVGDTTGDARSELAISSAQLGSLEPGVHLLAAPDRGDVEPEVLATWPIPDGDTWREQLAAAGDVDGDGRGDLVLTPSYAEKTWAAHLLAGSSRGRSSVDDALLTVAGGETSTASAGAGADGDGDGVPDLAFAVDHQVYVYSGATRGVVTLDDADVHLAEPGEDAFGYGIGWIEDPSLGPARLSFGRGDYREEVVPLSIGLYTLDPTASSGAVLTAALYGDEPYEPDGVVPVGDVDGDGALDLAVYSGEHTWILPSPREGSVEVATARMGVSAYQAQAAAAGDVDQDGCDDVLIAFNDLGDLGFAGLWLGGPPP